MGMRWHRNSPAAVTRKQRVSLLRENWNRKRVGRWCPRQESNLYLKLRRLTVYPLTYEGSVKNFIALRVVIRSTSSREIPFVSAIHFAISRTFAGSLRTRVPFCTRRTSGGRYGASVSIII